MAVQFFFADPKKDMGEVLSSGLKAGQEFRQAGIKNDLDSVYNQHVVTEPQYDAAGNVTARPGDLNASGFIKSAQEAGLPMEESMKYLAHQKAIRDAQLDTATSESMIRAAGYNPSPSVTGRAGAPIGNPATTQEQQAGGDTTGGASGTGNGAGEGANFLDTLKSWFTEKKAAGAGDTSLKAVDELTPAQEAITGTPNETIQAANGMIGGLDAAIKTGANPNGTKIETPLVQTPAYNPLTGEQVGIAGDGKTAPTPVTVNGDGKTESNPMDLGEGTILVQLAKKVNGGRGVLDTRTAGQAVQDTYVEPKSEGVGVGVDQAEANGEFAWTPVDDNSSAFRKYKTTLDSRLKGAGMVDAEGNAAPSMLLKKLYTAIYNQNLSAKPDPRLIALGAEGRKKYLEMDAEYKASQIKAAGLASKAVLDARQKLSEEANAYGVQTIAGKTEARTEEKHEADMGGRRAGGDGEIIRLRSTGVSEAEKTRGELIGNAYLDLKEAKAIGGFEGAYAMAKAAAKADGNVNRDVIVAELIGMGAVPSGDAVLLKSLMDGSGNLTSDIYNQFRAKYASLGKGDSGKKMEAWYTAKSKNMKDAMKLVGYGVLEKKSKDRTAKDDLEDALGKGKGKSKRASKNWTSKPDGTEQAGDTYKGHTLGTDGKWH